MAGRYLVYSEYINSGEVWLGVVPAHWVLMQAKHCFLLQRGHDLSSDKMVNGDFPVYGSNGVIGMHNIFNTKAPSVTVGRSGSVGEVNYVQEDYWAHNTALYLKEFKGSPPKFLYYLLLALSPKRLSAGSVVGTLDRNNIHAQLVALPLECEREVIANFLDHETAKIDTLIAKQQQLIKLLKEKRQAVISHAVTKGLNPDASMKDSGVEWLGEVPEHWVVAKYKFCASRVVVGIAEAATHAYADSGVPIIRSTNIGEDGLRTSDLLYIKEAFAEQNKSKYLYAKDVVTVRTGFPGISSVIPESLNKSQCFTNLIATPLKSHVPEFLSEYLNSHTGKSYFELLGWGSAQKNISVPILQNIPIAFPPLVEEKYIVEYVSKQKKRFDDLTTKASQSIELMQERRTALISAAVTGKIDVRNWQSDQTEPRKESRA